MSRRSSRNDNRFSRLIGNGNSCHCRFLLIGPKIPCRTLPPSDLLTTPPRAVEFACAFPQGCYPGPAADHASKTWRIGDIGVSGRIGGRRAEPARMARTRIALAVGALCMVVAP